MKINRIDWIDQTKGFAIFLVVYGHNFPFIEKYIYSFHMPLFFFVAGFFHPKVTSSFTILIKRAKQILIPYFIWSGLLFTFWYFIGRNYGESASMGLSPYKNLIGIFYAQGGQQFMDWGIPMWFLPTIFLTFLTFFFLQRIHHKKLYYLTVLVLPFIGFLIPRFFEINLPWSIDVMLVALIFYISGFYFLPIFKKITQQKIYVLLIITGIIHFSLFMLNTKIDMYRSIYGNELLFIINGFSGAIFYLLFFKIFPYFKFLSFLGKFTIPILAMQLRAFTIIKLFLMLVLGITMFHFSETEKFLYSVLQILLMVPILLIIKKYIPILNGKFKNL